MKISSRWLTFFLFSFAACLVVMAQTNIPVGGDTLPVVDGSEVVPAAEGSVFTNLQYIIPLLAPVIVMLIKKVPGWFETKFSSRFLPYVCVGVAFVLMLILDLTGTLDIPLWIAGPVAGAIGIGSRELLTNGLKLIGVMETTPEVVTPEVKPEVRTTAWAADPNKRT